MITSPATRGNTTTVTERALPTCHEIVFALARQGRQAPPWNALPGTVSRLGQQAVALHFAPARWLLVDAGAESMAGAVAAGAVAIEVDGKWRCFELRGAGAVAILSAGVNVATVLGSRDCAAVPLFDCPALLARCADGDAYDIYVHASYAVSLQRALQLAQQRAAQS